MTLHFDRIGSLQPREQDARKYAQLYVCDSTTELQARMDLNKELNAQIMQALQEMLHAINPYVKTYKMARERLGDDTAKEFHIKWYTDIGGMNQRRYNAPQVGEVGVIVIGADGEENTRARHIIVQPKHGLPKPISQFSSCYDALHYVLLFPYGTNGWSVELKKALHALDDRNKSMTVKKFYRYMLGVRPSAGLPLMPYALGRLFQQFVCDMFCKMEDQNLLYIGLNQSQIRAELYGS